MTAYEITFRIVTPNAPNSAKVVARLADIFRNSLGLAADAPARRSPRSSRTARASGSG